jgi:hypothetical protein
MTSHELAKKLLKKEDLPILIMPSDDKSWVGCIYLKDVKEGNQLYSSNPAREPGKIIILEITNEFECR